MPGVFGEIAETATGGNAHHDSLQVSLNRRFAQGITITANYTWARSIDTLSDDQVNPTAVSFSESTNLNLDRAISDFTTPHRFALSYLWELPGTKRWGIVGKELINGWQVNGITEIRSGNPFNLLSGNDSNLDGIQTDRPDVVGDPHLASGRSRSDLIAKFFNTAAFKPAARLNGNAGRNLLYGPASVNWDFSAFKNFKVPETRFIQFRGELFNLFNEVNFGAPNATLTSPSFGRILTASQPRVVQFGLKFVF